MQIKFISKTGQETSMDCQSIVSIDGKPYSDNTDLVQDIRDACNFMAGQIRALEMAVFGQAQEENVADQSGC